METINTVEFKTLHTQLIGREIVITVREQVTTYSEEFNQAYLDSRNLGGTIHRVVKPREVLTLKDVNTYYGTPSVVKKNMLRSREKRGAPTSHITIQTAKNFLQNVRTNRECYRIITTKVKDGKLTYGIMPVKNPNFMEYLLTGLAVLTNFYTLKLTN